MLYISAHLVEHLLDSINSALISILIQFVATHSILPQVFADENLVPDCAGHVRTAGLDVLPVHEAARPVGLDPAGQRLGGEGEESAGGDALTD